MTSIIAGKQVAVSYEEESEVPLKVGVSFAIFVLSFFAVSFPAISKRARFLRIPSLVFFIGKHFGTGVILSTAFVHLLPDSFNALSSKWTGFIILASLLSIFLVEYITTAYVDHLQSYASAPPSPSQSPSRASSRTRELPNETASVHEETPLLHPSRASTVRTGYAVINEEDSTPDQTSVIEVYTSPSKSRSHSSLIHKSHDAAETEEEIIFGGAHHRHEERSSHASHSLPPTVGKAGGVAVGKKVTVNMLYNEDSEEERTKKLVAETQHHHHHHHHHHHSHSSGTQELGHPHPHHCHGHTHLDIENLHNAEDCDHDDDESELGEEVKVGRRRQIVGILILQIGIMLHSFVIGLTMSVSSGSEFTTLVTAILFHQIFEGLSLGIRIAALPSETKHGAFSRLPGYILKPLLTLSFALTTPTGLWIGLAAFSSTSASSPHLKQMQGVLSAMSAGMLVYAACVEMLAGDFIMDPMMWRSGIKRQILALVSLVLGVAAMSAIE